jgi:hypothetical protein
MRIDDNRSKSNTKKSADTNRARHQRKAATPARPREAREGRPAERTASPRRGTAADLDRDGSEAGSDPVAARPLIRRQSDAASTLTDGASSDFDAVAAEEGDDAPLAHSLSADGAERTARAGSTEQTGGSTEQTGGSAQTDETEQTGDSAQTDETEQAGDSEQARSGNANQSNTETYSENGVTYTRETRTGARGLEVTTTTYEVDGVSYTETVTQNSGGGSSIRVEAVNGDRTEISETRTHSVPGDLETYLPEGYVDSINFDRDQPRGATQQTVETTTVIDNSQDPPVTTVTSESTTYSQEVVSGIPGGNPQNSEGQTVQLSHGANNSPYHAATYEDVEFDPEASGHTISYTQATQLDAQGNPQSSTTLSSEARLVGRGEDGHEVVISTRSDNIVDGQGNSSLILTNQSLGTIPADDLAIEENLQHNIGVHDDELLERLQGSQGPWLDFRETTVHSDGGPGMGVTTTEFGELDRDGDSRSLTVVRDGQTESHTYRLVSEGGDRVQTQTQVPGTDYNAVTDLQHGPNGTFTSSSQTTFEGEVIASSNASRELAFPAGQALPTEPPEGFSPQLWQQFLAENPNGPVYLDQMDSRSQDEEGRTITTENRAYESSTAQVGLVASDGPDGPDQSQFFSASGPEPRATVLASDGTIAELSEDSLSIDGVTKASNLGLQLGSGNQALQTLLGELDGASYTPGRLSRALGPIGAFLGAVDLFRAGDLSERASATGGLLGGAGSSLELLGTAGRVGRLAKGAGIAGGILTGGVGVYELFQGEYAKGTADLVAGGATIAAVLLLTSNPVGAAIAGTIAVGASIVRLFLDHEEPPEQPAWEF